MELNVYAEAFITEYIECMLIKNPKYNIFNIVVHHDIYAQFTEPEITGFGLHNSEVPPQYVKILERQGCKVYMYCTPFCKKHTLSHGV